MHTLHTMHVNSPGQWQLKSAANSGYHSGPLEQARLLYMGSSPRGLNKLQFRRRRSALVVLPQYDICWTEDELNTAIGNKYGIGAAPRSLRRARPASMRLLSRVAEDLPTTQLNCVAARTAQTQLDAVHLSCGLELVQSHVLCRRVAVRPSGSRKSSPC